MEHENGPMNITDKIILQYDTQKIVGLNQTLIFLEAQYWRSNYGIYNNRMCVFTNLRIAKWLRAAQVGHGKAI